MTETIEVSDDLAERIDAHRDEGEDREQFLTELLDHFEVEGRFLREGYSGEP